MNHPVAHPIAVIGDGWSAFSAVAFLARAGREVRWITGTGARLLAPLPLTEAGLTDDGSQGAEVMSASQAWKRLADLYGLDAGTPESGSFLREFRNKSFREPQWIKTPDVHARKEAREELLWAPEKRISPLIEERLAMPLWEVEEAIRKQLAGEGFSHVKRIEGIPVKEIKSAEDGEVSVVLGSGETIACSRVIYADKWSALGGIEGLPKPLSFARQREPHGALQALFTHHEPMGLGLQEAFYTTLHRESGEAFERHAWGFFSSNGAQSLWTVLLTPEEVEDNHEIAKKLRRVKQALDRMFTGGEWLPEGRADFMSNVKEEQVRFEDAMIFAAGDAPMAPFYAGKKADPKLAFVTDGYGPSSAIVQVASLLASELGFTLGAEAATPGVTTASIDADQGGNARSAEAE